MPKVCWVKYVAEYLESYAALFLWSCCSRKHGKNKPLLAQVFEIAFLVQIMALNLVPAYSNLLAPVTVAALGMLQEHILIFTHCLKSLAELNRAV